MSLWRQKRYAEVSFNTYARKFVFAAGRIKTEDNLGQVLPLQLVYPVLLLVSVDGHEKDQTLNDEIHFGGELYARQPGD